MTFVVTTLVHGIGFGLMLYLLSLGLILIYSMMGVLNFAHGAMYMLGAYLAYSMAQHFGFWAALGIAPLLVAGLAWLFDRFVLSRFAHRGVLQQLLLTFGLAVVVGELVILFWGASPIQVPIPETLQGTMTLWGDATLGSDVQVPVIRIFSAFVALMCLLTMAWIWRNTRLGLILQAAKEHPEVVRALGHNLPGLMGAVFATGAGLAALAGALAAPVYLLEPSMAANMLSLVFVVVVMGGQTSVWGAFWAALGIGLLQTGATLSPWAWLPPVASLLPFIAMIVLLALRKTDLSHHA